jgi:hypothetical protein
MNDKNKFMCSFQNSNVSLYDTNKESLIWSSKSLEENNDSLIYKGKLFY